MHATTHKNIKVNCTWRQNMIPTLYDGHDKLLKVGKYKCDLIYMVNICIHF